MLRSAGADGEPMNRTLAIIAIVGGLALLSIIALSTLVVAGGVHKQDERERAAERLACIERNITSATTVSCSYR